MGRLSSEKLARLKKAFTEEAMLPSQAAQVADVTYATAKRYYDLWADEIKRSLESKLLSNLEDSVRRQAKKSAKH